jgi:ClpP class serine protease
MTHKHSVRKAGAYLLDQKLLSEYGSEIVCIDARSIGKRFRLYKSKPTAAMNRLVFSSEVFEGTGQQAPDAVAPNEVPALVEVRVYGPLEQRATAHECGYSDGHDAVAERLMNAMDASDVLFVADSPGGAAAGLKESVDRVLRYKTKTGRRVTGWLDEMAGSAAYWWMACVCDEIFGPEAMQVGSIGARAAHMSISGALQMAGEEPTYFCWPGAGKIAFAPEFPLSDLAKARGNRDVEQCGKAFASAIVKARGITYEEIVKLDADVLSGHDAVRAKLVDGVSTYEEVLAYAIAQSTRGKSL